MKQDIEVSIITVGMNHLKLLQNYLHSLYETCKPLINFELIYVDNNSIDGSIEYVRQNFPKVKIIENKTVKGFATNNNIGVRNSKGKYILILNPDIILLPGAVDKLHFYLKENKSIGILVPKLLNVDLTVQFSVRKFMNFKIIFYRFLHMGKDILKSKVTQDYLLTTFDRNKTQPINWAFGAAMFLTREWFNQLNGFDESYFLYVEDVDICLRNWKLGKPVVYYPESVFIHAHQRSSSVGWNKTKLMHIKSMLRLFFKHNLFFRSYNFTS